jgi:hypothetical protein
VHKATVSVALAESGRGSEIRQVGAFENRPEGFGEAGGTTEQRRAAPEFLLRSRPLRLRAAPTADRLGT